MRPSQISKIHKEIKDVLDDYINGLAVDNSSVKKKFKELETFLMPLPIFSIHLIMIKPTTSGIKFKGS
jgi:hypothetical protein